MTSLLQLQSLWIPFHTFLQDESRVEVDFFWDFNAEGQNNYRGHFWLIPSPKWPPWRARETVFVINDLLPFSRCFKRREWIFCVISTCHANSSWWKKRTKKKITFAHCFKAKKSCLDIIVCCTKSSKWKLVVTQPFFAMKRQLQFIERFGLRLLQGSWRLWELLFVEKDIRNTRQKSIKKIYEV